MANPQQAAIKAQAELHHAYLLGLQLMVATRHGEKTMEEWMFRLFHRQHLDKFLSSFEKLGLSGLPDAVACARYHVISNSIGGVPVEYMEESPKKAWVRFRYPRWMYDGPTLCGVTPGVGRGFLRGWYAHNGISLKNPRLGYVCVSEDVTGEFGFCGYFKEYDHDLKDEERLQFSKGELPPPFDADSQPAPPASDWSAERLAKANRNYAMEYVRNGLTELSQVIGEESTLEIGQLSARLIGLQYYPKIAQFMEAADGNCIDARNFLMDVMIGLGDDVFATDHATLDQASFEQTGLRILKGLEGKERQLLFACWQELWVGCLRSHREMLDLNVEKINEEKIVWHIFNRRNG
ncbi:hypothetical protein [Sneathiella glossodoripedis]|uniref:hypothetical protein n=1 Tax=Sneathiella glossodoripedis TaxID=418853 RepID=UPI00047118D2|nr:hypothetical protein [Sneathiella glossodoripedis]